MTEKEFAEQMEHTAWLNHRERHRQRAAMKDAAAVCDLYAHLERLTRVCQNLIDEVPDPGSEAFAAIYCAKECLAKYQPKTE